MSVHKQEAFAGGKSIDRIHKLADYIRHGHTHLFQLLYQNKENTLKVIESILVQCFGLF